MNLNYGDERGLIEFWQSARTVPERKVKRITINTRTYAAPFPQKSSLEIRGVAYLLEHLKKAASGVQVRSNAFHSRSYCNAKICGKPVLNEEMPVNKYQKKINHMSKLAETMFITLNC